VKGLQVTGSILDGEHRRCVSTEEKLDEIGAKFEISLRKKLARIAKVMDLSVSAYAANILTFSIPVCIIL
jgi:hypothetical protein